ncbi:acetyl/propionyl/methylcrotonyl-CoA carboxylase subunit alpha [Leucobacter sp. UT-8R-CII-1-4]|nr:acetyl/propionyl/methylcrotonyl-CoA carboxylase subunit alpha [Leucobacter sp. UT-8R-CII-1-4]MDI6022568.1 acetyl/propionyl/methylcrotonyl-CoA carboxylase subunit alpha [Leucobacter sp. UT-8R-CII-1-4]
MQMFNTVLIANRGEIACRIMKTLRGMGIRSAAVYSDADAEARHVKLADISKRIGPAPAAQSYLNIPAVIDAALEVGAQAIHPGYGFLAENAEFARACEAAGLVFIGPSAYAIETMGDKISAKTAVSERGVPTVPGIARPGLSDAELLAEAPAIGYPMLIKPSAGGGGKGMHVVTKTEELADSIAAARREAAASFGDDALFIERYLSTPRHIEVQVLADAHGNVVHLGERECSLQRRHQKVIEEAPSPLLDERTRAAIGEAACETARSVGYQGAGTVEFIVEASQPDEFFFMEMNTRLQVEHPVTEEITGVDLVEQQLRIAAGQALSLIQQDIVLRGHSFEARLYAEDPAAGFLPTGGHVSHVAHPSGEGVRVDTAIESGLNVSIDYDPMLAKIITWGEDREAARRRLVHALDETAVLGFPTNIEFMRLLLELPEVVAGDLDTGLIARVQDSFEYAAASEREFAEAALLIEHTRADAQNASASRETAASTATGPWASVSGWRLGSAAPRTHALVSAGEQHTVSLTRSLSDAEADTVTVDAFSTGAKLEELGAHQYSTTIDGTTRTITAMVQRSSGTATVLLAHDGAVFEISEYRVSHSGDDAAAGGPQLESPMPGTVVLVHASDGTQVEVGDPVIVVEAMKMEHVLRATVAGTVALRAGVGDQVSRGQTLAVIQVHTEDATTEEAS